MELGEWIAQNGHILIYGAGRYGLMGALAGAVKENGGKVIGVIPRFLDSREGHRDDLDQLEYVDSMAERKTRMIELGDAFIALPGGVGTLEEIAEIIGVDTLGYLPIEQLDKLVGNHDYCAACFHGKYPTKIPTDLRKDRFERKISEKFQTTV